MPKSSPPKQKRYEYLNGDGLPGFAPRPKYHDCHGTIVAIDGTCAASAASDAGLTDSGVDVASKRSTFSLWIRSFATCAQRAGLDWLSFETISTP